MDFDVSVCPLSIKSRNDLVTWIDDKDFYELNRSFRASYKIRLGDKYVLDDEDGVFVIISAILVCLYKISRNQDCNLVMSDSPPNISFKTILNSSELRVELNSYGKVIYEEVVNRSCVVLKLREQADRCISSVIRSASITNCDLYELLDLMNPNFSGKLQGVAN